MEQKITCVFDTRYNAKLYTCEVENQEICSKKVLSFIGKHLTGKDNTDVKFLSFSYCNISKFPQGLTKVFPKLIHIQLNECGLSQLTRNCLKEYSNLTALYLAGNNIPYLPGDLFEDLKFLKICNLSKSKIEVIEPNILDKCAQLKYMNFQKNICINKCFNSITFDSSLEGMKKELREKYPRWGDRIKNFKGKITSEVLKLIKEISEKDETIQKIKKESESYESALIMLENKRYQEIQVLNTNKDDQIHSLEQIINELNGKLKSFENKNEEIEKLEQKVRDTEQLMTKKLQEQKCSNDEEIMKLKKECQTFQRKSKKLEAVLETTTENAKIKLNESESKNQKVRALLIARIEMIENLKQKLSIIEKEKKEFQNMIVNKDKRIKIIEEKLRLCDIQIKKFNEENSKLLRTIDAVKAENRELLEHKIKNVQILEDFEQKMKNKLLESSKEMQELLKPYENLLETEDRNQEIIKTNSQTLERNKFLEHKLLEAEAENESLKLQSGFTQDFKTLMENDELKDITIITDNEEFKAHKFVLAARSPTFASIFMKNVHAKRLTLTDVSTDIFHIILNFIYTLNFPNSNEIDYIELFKASNKFQIEKLKVFATNKMLQQINFDNALEVLKISNKYGYEELRKKSFDEIKNFFDTEKIHESLAFDTKKLEKLIELKKEKNKMIAELELEFKKLLEE